MDGQAIAPAVLHNRPLELADRTLQGASLFPCFDTAHGTLDAPNERTAGAHRRHTKTAKKPKKVEHQGTVHRWMLVWDDSPWIVLLDPAVHPFRLSTFGRPVLDLRYHQLRDVQRTDLAAVAGLWHWDPWWRLAEPRYHLHPAVPALKATNSYPHATTRLQRWFGQPWFALDLRTVTKAQSGLPEASIPPKDRGAQTTRRREPFRVGTRWVLADRIAPEARPARPSGQRRILS